MRVLLNRDCVGRHLFLRGRRKKHLKKLLDTGIISRGVSEWASPTVFVRKRDGTVRYCIDLRKVNEVTVTDRYPLPKISECIDALAGCEYFSCLDMAITRSRWKGRIGIRRHL